MLKKLLINEKYQQYGLYASLLCAVHCTVLPFFLIFIPTIGLTLFINDYYFPSMKSIVETSSSQKTFSTVFTTSLFLLTKVTV